MAREQIDDSILGSDDGYRQKIEKLSRREAARVKSKKHVFDIDGKTGNVKNPREADRGQKGKWLKRLRAERAANRQRFLRCVAICGVCLSVMSLGYAGKSVRDWWTYEEEVSAGRELFVHEWTPHDPLSKSGDGLGPVFNATSCAACRFQGGVGGAGSNKHNVTNFTVVPAGNRTESLAGVIHASATLPSAEESPESLERLYPPIPKLRVTPPNGCSYTIPGFNRIRTTVVSTPPLFGAGLIDQIPDVALHYDFAKKNLVNIKVEMIDGERSIGTGRVRLLSDGRVGKFGWKAQFATLEEFVAAACAMECGLSNPLKQQIEPGTFAASQPQAEKLDMDHRMLRNLVRFCAELPSPVIATSNDASVQSQIDLGRQVFAEIGCAECHTPDIGGVKAIYSDFRLHVVEESYDERESVYLEKLPAGKPFPNEWKTPPLWGLADSAPYWHDGSSPTIEQAITRHRRQAGQVTERYNKLGGTDKQEIGRASCRERV